MLTEEQKKANEQYFRLVLSLVASKNSTTYVYPRISETYTVKDGVFYGTERGVRHIRKITPKDFHSMVQVKGRGND